MNPVLDEVRSLLEQVSLPDFDPSWVGAGPLENTLCFGSEDGHLRFTSMEGKFLKEMKNAVRSGESVNGVAFVGNWMGVSARDEVVLWSLDDDFTRKSVCAPLPFGSHGVIATPSGRFLAALGPSGFATCLPVAEDIQSFNIGERPNEEVYFYRMASYRDSKACELGVVAMRKGGVGWMELSADGQARSLNAQSFSGLDVVDVCTADFGSSTGVVALGRDGTLILWKHRGAEPVTVRFDAIKGTGYRVLSVGNQLFVLTSRALYAIQDLIDAVAAGGSHDIRANGVELPMEAVDAAVVGGRWVYIVLPDGIQRLDASLLHLLPNADYADLRLIEMRLNRLDPECNSAEVALDVHQAA